METDAAVSMKAEFFDGSGGPAQPEGLSLSITLNALLIISTPSAGTPRHFFFFCPSSSKYFSFLAALAGSAKQSAGMCRTFGLSQVPQCCSFTNSQTPSLLIFAGHAIPAVFKMWIVFNGVLGKPGGGAGLAGLVGGLAPGLPHIAIAAAS